MDITSSLRKCFLLHSMEEKDLQEIVEKSGGIKKYKKGTKLFLEKGPANYFFVLIDGKVQVSHLTREGKETILKNILPGDSFAEVIVFEQSEYPATATALENSSVVRIDKNLFRKLLNDPKIANLFIINLIKKIRFLTQKVELFNTAKVSQRFYYFIETHYGPNEIIELKESKKEIAKEIGTIPETFSRMINKLKKDKMILSWNKKTLIFKKEIWKNYPQL